MSDCARRVLYSFLVFVLLLSALGAHFSEAQAVSTIFINEIHYNNIGPDTGEAIEIAGPAGTNLAGWSLVLYDGSGGFIYDTRTLSGVIPNQSNGYGTLSFSYPADGIQNDSFNGVALVNPGNMLVQFWSYGGIFVATEGPASGMWSTNMGVAESSSTPPGHSLQLTGGPGTRDTDYSWASAAPNTFGAVNNGQILGTPPPPSLVINEVHADPANDLPGDANGDGLRNFSDDEFVELVNTSASPLDLSGWALRDAVGIRHVFPTGSVIPVGCNLVVFGGGVPTGTFGNAVVQTASGGSLSLNNDGDTITVNNGVADVAAYTYGTEGNDNQSLTRVPDITGTIFTKHSLAAGSGGTLYSPGRKIDGTNFSGCIASDTTPPTLQTLNPADNATDVAVNTNLVLSFNENIRKGTGNITIHLAADSSVVQTIDIASAAVTISGMDLTINPPADLANSTSYYINIPAGAIEDVSGNDYAGFTDAATWNFTTIASLPSVLTYLVFNEVLPDPNSTTLNFDTDGDGTAEDADEFLELYNTSANPLDISGLQFWDAGGGRYFTVPASTTLGPNSFIVVVTNTAGGSLPSVNAGSHAFSAGASSLINNGGDNLVVYDPVKDVYIQAFYNGDSVDTPQSGYAGFSATATRLGSVQNLGNDRDGTSRALSPDGMITNPVNHNTIGSGNTLATPGKPNLSAPAIDLELTKTVDNSTPTEGSTITYTVTVTNASTSQAATNVVVYDYLPDTSTQINFAPTAVCTPGIPAVVNSTTLSFSFDTLPPGASASCSIYATILLGTNGISITNSAEVWSVTETNDPDSTPGNFSGTAAEDDEASVTVTVGTQCGAPADLVSGIQGSGALSPVDGLVRTIEGVVVGDFQTNARLSGFFLQEEAADQDGNPATSEGIFVFDGAAPAVDVNVGDVVRVTGTVDEYFNLTELTSVSKVEKCGAGVLPAPASITLPVASLDVWEQYEGMLVNIPQTLYATENYNLGRYGEVDLSVGSRLSNPTNVTTPGPAAIALQELNNRSRIQLEDGRTAQNPDPAPYIGAGNTLRAGDTLPGLMGVLHFAYGRYEIHPVGPVSFSRANARPAAPPAVGGTLRVASANVLNYFVTLDNSGPICGPSSNQDCRGADTAAEFTRQRDKIINEIIAINADVIGLMEMENHPADAALLDLVNGLNAAAGAGTYDALTTGPIGSDAIKVALIYKPATVSPLGSFAILDSTVDPSFIDTKNRPTLAQTFIETASGGKFTVAVNHLKSKGSDCNSLGDPDTGDGQGNCNITRTNAAAALVNWLATDPTGSGDPDFLIIGDLNAYALEDPVAAITSAGYTNLVSSFLGAGAYSYTFEGQAGYLDHALSSPGLTPQVSGVAEWHINADEPSALDYNDYNQPALYTSDFYRAADHDPVIIGLALGATPPTVVFGGRTIPSNGASLTSGPTQLFVEFSKDVRHDSSAQAANNVINYLLVESQGNGFQTASCASGPDPADTLFPINTASYSSASGFVATLGINHGVPLPAGSYRLYVCGTTSIEDLAGLELNGGVNDSLINFTVGAAVELPQTGFPQGMITPLGLQPQSLAYAETAMLLELPSLGVSLPILGVPLTENGWDVTWLGSSAGYLAGSAFPTWNGNTVLTAHVWDANNQPGPFARVKDLRYGDRLQIKAWGETYIYEVRESRLVAPNWVRTVMKSEELDWVTLITCEEYQTDGQTYASRRMVRAVLVDVR